MRRTLNRRPRPNPYALVNPIIGVNRTTARRNRVSGTNWETRPLAAPKARRPLRQTLIRMTIKIDAFIDSIIGVDGAAPSIKSALDAQETRDKRHCLLLFLQKKRCGAGRDDVVVQ